MPDTAIRPEARAATSAAAAIDVCSSDRWSAIDLCWERTAVEAVERYRNGDSAGARQRWEHCLQIAEEHFGREDPRLAASLANHAFVLRRQGDEQRARKAFEASLESWKRAGTWAVFVATELSQRAAGAETAYLAEPFGPDPRSLRRHLQALVEAGRDATTEMCRSGRLPLGSLEQWRKERSHEPGDIRRLVAAVRLLVSQPEDEG
jgi:hypothetical protein